MAKWYKLFKYLNLSKPVAYPGSEVRVGTGGPGDGSPPTGSMSEAPVRVWRRNTQKPDIY